MGRRYPVSISSLKSYTRCGQQWYLERFHKPKPPKSPAAWLARGIACHDAAMIWEQADRALDVKATYYKLYDESIEKLKQEQPDLSFWTRTPRVKLTKTDIELRREDGLLQILKYVEEAVEAPWSIYRLSNNELAIELSFEVDLINPKDPHDILPIRGAIDQILEWPDGSLTLRDLKTGNLEKDPRQISTYGWVAQHHLNLPEVIFGDYFSSKLNREGNCYGSSGMIKLNRTTEYITKTYFDLSDSIQRRVFLPNPSTKNCLFCPVKDLCPEYQA